MRNNTEMEAKFKNFKDCYARSKNFKDAIFELHVEIILKMISAKCQQNTLSSMGEMSAPGA